MNWLFLKGLARGQVHWDRQAEALSAALPEARVFFLDLPGVGEAVARPAPATVAAITADLRTRWVELAAENDGPWAILAISLGGMLAMQWMTDFPGDFQRAVVIVSSAANVSPPWKRLMPATMPGFLRALVSSDIEKRERLVLGTITNDEAHFEPLVAKFIALAPTCPLPAHATLRQLLAASLWRAPASLPIPTLFLGSDADRMVHPSCTQELAERFAAPHEMHPTAGHEIPLDDPDWVATTIRAYG
jgi:alpha-beta hydrolase superfamily lysophospholipase